jgi:hypothetical protein
MTRSSTPHHQGPRHPQPSAFHQGAQAGVGAVAGVFLLAATLAGVCLFGGMALAGYANARYEFVAIGVLALGGLGYGLYSFFHHPT